MTKPLMDLRHATLFPNEGDGMAHEDDERWYGTPDFNYSAHQLRHDVGLLEYHIAEQFDGVYEALARGELSVDDFIDLRNNVMTLLRRLHPDDAATQGTEVDPDIPF